MTVGDARQPNPGAQLTLPFPKAGRLVEHAYWEITIAAAGTPEQVKALGDIRRLPKPWEPATCTHPDLRLDLWAWLDDVVTWINHEHIWDTASFIPTCWPNHPHLIHDLAVLADQRRRAGNANTSDALEDWHRYALPAFLDRMRAQLKSHCEDGHQTWPSTSRHARHTSDPHRRHRHQSFKRDIEAMAPTGQLDLASPGGARLHLVDGVLLDETTGEIVD